MASIRIELQVRREVIGHLEGKYDLTETERLINRNTHNLARHQLTWFKRMDEIQWVSDYEDILTTLEGARK